MLYLNTVPLELRPYQQEVLSPFLHGALDAREDCFLIHELNRELGRVYLPTLNQG